MIFIPNFTNDSHYIKKRAIQEEEMIKERKSTVKIQKSIKQDFELQIKGLQDYDYDAPATNQKDQLERGIPANLVLKTPMKAKKVFVEKEMVEKWQLMSDHQRSQLKARIFLKKSKLMDDELIKVGVKVKRQVEQTRQSDLYSHRNNQIQNVQKKGNGKIEVEVFWDCKNEYQTRPNVDMEFFNQAFTFDKIKTSSSTLTHVTSDFSEAFRGYLVSLRIKPTVKSEYTPSFYRRQIKIELPVTKLLDPVIVTSQKSFYRQLDHFDLLLETSTYSLDEQFFPSSKEFLHVFKNMVQIKENSFGGYYKCLGDQNIFFLSFEFSQDFLVFKVNVRYQYYELESKLKDILKQIVMLFSDFYV